jgi:hypothetical protein
VAADHRKRAAIALAPPRALVDTGALLAYLDRSDRWHDRCRAALVELRLPLVTSPAVLAELFHLVGDSPGEIAAAWGFVRSGAVTVAAIPDAELADLETLMRQYRDRPMDLADATLVHLARREGVSTVFTIDHDDFETYRIGPRKKFSIVPER